MTYLSKYFLTDPLTHSMTGVTARRCYRIQKPWWIERKILISSKWINPFGKASSPLKMKNRVITLLPPLLQYGIRVSPHFITSPSFQFQIIIISKIFSQRVNILLKKNVLLIKVYFPGPIFNGVGDERLQI